VFSEGFGVGERHGRLEQGRGDLFVQGSGGPRQVGRMYSWSVAVGCLLLDGSFYWLDLLLVGSFLIVVGYFYCGWIFL
jgi:hypothetical protein